MKRMFLVGGVVAAVVLAGCGSTPAARKASLDSYVASLGGSSNLQVTITASDKGASASTVKAEKILKVLSFGIDFSTPDGSAISQSGGTASMELTASVSGTNFVDLRVIDSNLFLKANVNALSAVPGLPLSASQIAAAQFAVGGRWFEVPKSLLNKYFPTNPAVVAKAAQDRAKIAKVMDAITNAIVSAPYKDLGNGSYSETGTLLSFLKAIYPTLRSVSTLPPLPASTSKSAKGSYTLTISTSGSSATGASIAITGPNGTSGNETVAIAATFTHSGYSVSAPSGATLITPALINGLLGKGLG